MLWRMQDADWICLDFGRLTEKNVDFGTCLLVPAVQCIPGASAATHPGA